MTKRKRGGEMTTQGMVCSMSWRRDCWDTAVAGSLFATLKVELVHDATWVARSPARATLFDSIELSDPGQRRHSAVGYFSPRAFEERGAQRDAAA
jgi:putative transposase